MKQGWRIERTVHGEMFLSPDGSSKVAWHRAHASSDPHALDGSIQELRKAGFDTSQIKG